MIKKTITTDDPFNEGESVTKDYYFHLTTADLIEMEIGTEGGMQERLQKMVEDENGHDILETIKQFISKSVGEKRGSEFVKTAAISEAFMASEAYSTLLLELATDAEKSAEFINGITPKNLESDMKKFGNAKKKSDKPKVGKGAGGFN